MKDLSIADIQQRVTQYRPGASPRPLDYRAAAVLIPFFETDEGLSVVFMKRPERPEPHGGQISFPGGGRDPEDTNDMETALRETEEEYGVEREKIEVWGALKRRGTRASYYWITPFVGKIASDAYFKPSVEEVERLIYVPFSHLISDQSYAFDKFPWRGNYYDSHLFTYKDDTIWGLTAMVLASFISFLKTGEEFG